MSDNIQKSIQEQNDARRMNILKGFKEFDTPLEKARQVGEKKVGSDGITREWVDRGNGTFGWRRVRGSKKQENKNNSEPKTLDIKSKALEYWKQLSKLDKKTLISKIGSRVHSIDKNTPKSDIISELVSDKFGSNWSKQNDSKAPNKEKILDEFTLKYKNSAGQQVEKTFRSMTISEAKSRISGTEIQLKSDNKQKPSGDRTRIRKMRQMKKEVVSREDGTFEYDNNGSKFFSKPDESMKSFIERIEPDVLFKKKVGADKNVDISFDDFKNKMIEKFSGYKLRESSGIGGKIVSFSKHVRGEDSSFDIQEQNNENTAGKFYVNMLTKKEVSSRSLADPTKNYQTTSARVVKHKKTHTRKYADTLEDVEKIINSHMKKIGEEVKKGIDELSIQKAKQILGL